jgi:hypothetical protein
MARTLLLTVGMLASLFSVVSYGYYMANFEEPPKDNLLYRTGKFLDDMWFPLADYGAVRDQ